MAKNKSCKEKSSSTTRKEKEVLSPNLPIQLLRLAWFRYTGRLTSQISLGNTKSWLTTSRRCKNDKHSTYPQLAWIPDSTHSKWNYNGWFFNWTSESDWQITHLSTRDPYDANFQSMVFSNVVRCDGKSYGLSLQGCLVGLAEGDTDTEICRTRAVPSVYAKYFKEYMFESMGEVMLVFLIYRKLNGNIPDDIEVYKLDTDGKLDLVKVDRMDGRVLFVDKESCLWFDSEELDCKGDCIYFTGGGLDGNDEWWRYDMESKSFSTAWKKRTRKINRWKFQSDMEPVLLVR